MMKVASNLAKGGIFTALGFIFIYFSWILPINKLYLLALSSAVIALSVIITSLKNSFIVYAATALISIFFLGINGITFSYVLFFGIYSVIKYYIEKLRKLYLELPLKLIFFNGIFFILYSLFKAFIADGLPKSFPFSALIMLLQLVFLIYDYTLTVFVTYAANRFINKIK